MAINKFLGPANLQVSGLPVQGRSGGGLFTSDGQVIGVCNAADPTDNGGLYAALAVIHEELDEVGLTAIYQHPQAAPPSAVAASRQMPGPASAAGAIAEGMMPAAMGVAEADPTAMAQLRKLSESAEVICIVRPLADPRAKSEVVVLDRASPAFLEQLAVDRQAQKSRHLTSHRESTEPVVRSRRN